MTLQFLSNYFWRTLCLSSLSCLCLLNVFAFENSIFSIIFSINNEKGGKKLSYLLMSVLSFRHRWEVPLPKMIKILYTSIHKLGTDPRFLKLEPVFRSSKVMCGDRQRYAIFWIFASTLPFFISFLVLIIQN